MPPPCSPCPTPPVSAESAPGAVPRVWWLVLLAAAFIGFASNIWNAPLFDLDEGAFSEATVEMIHSGNWLTTTLDGAPRYDKPILIYWLQAASVKAFGVHAFAFRLPSVLCACLWMLAVWGFARRYAGGNRAALFAALTVPLSLLPGIIGHAAIADALLNLFLALTFFDIYRYFDQPSKATALRVYLWMGLGLLAKGPVAVVLPLIVGTLFFIWQGRTRDWAHAVLFFPGWLVTAAVVAVWVVPLYLGGRIDFLNHFIFQQNLGRYSETLQGHGGKLWYYVLWFPLILLPFTALVVPVFKRGFGRRPEPLDGYLCLWFGVTFVIFTFSGTQLPHYLLYGCTGLFVLFGKYHDRAPPRAATLAPALLLAAALAALPWLLPLVHTPPQRTFEAGILALVQQGFGITYHVLTIAGLAIVLVLMAWRGLPPWRALLVAAFAQAVVVWWAVVPVYAAAQQGPTREAAQLAKSLGLPTVSYGKYLPSFSVYRGAPTPHGLPAPGELVFVSRDAIPALEKGLDGATLEPKFEKGGVALFLRPALQR
ncbi:MAG: glycosyltransferase family 39 protein [Nevskiaceae bacterium]|nr:MAG: glycosyltransferase family 39 protein [Nevskiaceae bacterium]TBR74019.1 MAG: glycosyltransferase family 39 protein [Nevskiaceae bacterium]